jgi:hypothetical protein
MQRIGMYTVKYKEKWERVVRKHEKEEEINLCAQ